MARFAAIDVGSNAIRLRIVEADRPASPQDSQLRLPDDGRDEPRFREITSLRAPVRLGTEVFLTGRIPAAAVGQACAALREFRAAMDAAKIDAYRATATSAVREAQNAATLVERARREAGIDLEVIEGVEEARLIELAVVRRVPALAETSALLVDVGGGSTELTMLDRGEHAFSVSLPIGTVRLVETFLRGDGPPDSVGRIAQSGSFDRARARLVAEMIDRALGEAEGYLSRTTFDVLVGTGGNVETMADLCPAKPGASPFARAIDVPAMKALHGKLVKMTPAERRDAYGLRPDRADTIVPAAAIFLRLAERFKKSHVVAPGVGLKEGILEELAAKHFRLWDDESQAQSVLTACTKLGHRYRFDEAHGRLVAALSARLFDDLQPLHALGHRDRLLLRAAALLHDVGDFVRYDGHHKHSYYLIQNSDIIGLTPDERAIVANTARYHRKSLPDPSHPAFRELDRDARGKVRALAAILRIADALDREHLGKVRDVRGVVDAGRGKLVLYVTGSEDRELEEWTVRAKADLLREVFDLDVTFAEPLRTSEAPRAG
jgi:exopolyphosphatase/guanosine-5'-triphosphate,3'-diphosphate pyrophosphatase